MKGEAGGDGSAGCGRAGGGMPAAPWQPRVGGRAGPGAKSGAFFYAFQGKPRTRGFAFPAAGSALWFCAAPRVGRAKRSEPGRRGEPRGVCPPGSPHRRGRGGGAGAGAERDRKSVV